MVGRAVSYKPVRKENLLASRLGQRSVALVRDYADNLHPFRFWRAKPDENTLAYG
jgi:hypothetical protein